MPRQILLAEDHPTFSIGLKRQIEVHLHIGSENVHNVRSRKKVLEALESGIYTDLILDIGLLDGQAFEILDTIRRLYPSLNIMIYSANASPAYRKAARNYGIKHYLAKGIEEQEIIDGLRKFFDNEPMPYHEPPANPFSVLSPRELQVLDYLLKGKGTKEIAGILGLSLKTISEYKNRIYKETDATNIADLVVLATAYKMIE